MQNIPVQFADEIRSTILAGVILAITTAQAHGVLSAAYIRGILALAQHQVIGLGLSWPAFVKDTREALGAVQLIGSTSSSREVLAR